MRDSKRPVLYELNMKMNSVIIIINVTNMIILYKGTKTRMYNIDVGGRST